MMMINPMLELLIQNHLLFRNECDISFTLLGENIRNKCLLSNNGMIELVAVWDNSVH